ncbi:SDR family oxidoreductase [Ramlibacter ginsenosidimutans]|uniref:SDR family oxidoreductase n=1 Tax=Ramlibacter ginsenosidimutans TaxID=502333 RepID=A0A934TWU4_9BURK|nr:SDR family oxidoreductase [Ramlibacter ginsenosidimutans]MBK6008711.1 SDR family oxidoreductase [Ramlibacter ginsenosidimutans]
MSTSPSADCSACHFPPPSFPGLSGRLAWVTGHRGGIGSEVARLLEASGCQVAGLDLPDVDLADLGALESRAAQLAREHGAPQVLVNCAGTTLLGSIPDTSLADLQRVMAVNFTAPFLLMKSVLPDMVRAGGGAIVNVASDQALIGKPLSAAYGASKGALAQLTRSAAIDFGRHNVRVNCIAPGSTDTAMLREVMESSRSFESLFPPPSGVGWHGRPKSRSPRCSSRPQRLRSSPAP